MPVPGIVQLVNQMILKFIYVDIFFTEKWFLPFLTKLNDIENDRGINEYFEENGFESKILLMNLGSTLVFMFIKIGILTIFAVIHLLSKFISW
jgi:hypothetical protein